MRILISIIVLALSGLTQLGVATAKELPVSAYAELPNVQSVTISPDGKRLALVAGNTREERSIIITRLDGEGAAVRVPTNGEAPTGVTWLSNDRVGVYFKKFVTRLGGNLAQNEGRLVSISVDGKKQTAINPAAGVASRLPDDPDHVLMVSRAVQRGTSRSEARGVIGLYKVNIKNGRGTLVQAGERDTIAIYLDENNQPFARAAAERSNNNARIFDYFRIEVPDGKGWKTAFEITDVDVPNGGLPLSIHGYSPDRTVLYGSTERASDNTRSLYAIDLKDNTLEKVFSRSDVNVNSMGRDPVSGVFLGVSWFDDVRRTKYFVGGLQGLMDQLQGAFPGGTINILNWDENYRKFVVLVSGGTVASSYFLFDAQTGQLSLIADQYPNVPGEEVAEVRYISYKARDGLEIPAYLTLPKGRDLKDLPLIMHPHGGPESRDVPGFQFWPQMLANRGYAVLQPQFRGSAGFGEAFIRAGDKQWGRKMQTDLTDGVTHLVQQGIVDPDRVCIFGWSYGGYASVAGATLDAKTYRCTVAGAPVTDLVEMLNYERNRGGLRMRGLNTDASFGYWSKVIGDIVDDRELVRRMSPARNVDLVDGPLMLIHGTNDDIVPIKQSEIMYDAMVAAGKPVEIVRLEKEDHNITFGETRLEMMTALDNFMKQNNPPN